MILGTPLERAGAAGRGRRAGTAVALSDGKRLLASAGSRAAQTALAALVGREDRGRPETGVVTMDGGRAGLAVALDRGLWLDAVLPGAAAAGGPALGC